MKKRLWSVVAAVGTFRIGQRRTGWVGEFRVDLGADFGVSRLRRDRGAARIRSGRVRLWTAVRLRLDGAWLRTVFG